MDRRDLLRRIAILTGGVVIGGELFLSGGCTSDDKKVVPGLLLSEADLPLLDEIAETILPATSTPGAKAAGVGRFMITYVNDCYNEKQAKAFREGLVKIEEECKKTHKKSFLEATPEERTSLLIQIEKSTKEFTEKFKEEQAAKEKAARDRGDEAFRKEAMPLQYFPLVKQLTLLGYFTSKEALTKAVRYTPVPGKWEPIIEYKKGDKLFAGLNGINT